MDKKEALRTLIKHSFVLSDQTKEALVAKLDSLAAADIMAIGKFLAMEKKKSLEDGSKLIAAVDLLLKQRGTK